jgi:hypothetical protein
MFGAGAGGGGGGRETAAGDPDNPRRQHRRGPSRQIWKADPGNGSAPSRGHNDQLVWAAGNRNVSPWEKEGWSTSTHPTRGGAATPPLLATLKMSSHTEDGKEIVYLQSRRYRPPHLARSPPPDRRAVSKTAGLALEWSPVPLAGGVAHLRRCAQPARAAIHRAAPVPRPGARHLPAVFPAIAGRPQQVSDRRATACRFTPSLQYACRWSGRPEASHSSSCTADRGARCRRSGTHMTTTVNAYAMNQYLAKPRLRRALHQLPNKNVVTASASAWSVNYGAGARRFHDVEAPDRLAPAPTWARISGLVARLLRRPDGPRPRTRFRPVRGRVDFHGVHD